MYCGVFVSVFCLFAHDADSVALVCPTVIEIVATHPAATNGCCVFKFQHPSYCFVFFPITPDYRKIGIAISNWLVIAGVVLDAVTPHAFLLNASPRTD